MTSIILGIIWIILFILSANVYIKISKGIEKKGWLYWNWPILTVIYTDILIVMFLIKLFI